MYYARSAPTRFQSLRLVGPRLGLCCDVSIKQELEGADVSEKSTVVTPPSVTAMALAEAPLLPALLTSSLGYKPAGTLNE